MNTPALAQFDYSVSTQVLESAEAQALVLLFSSAGPYQNSNDAALSAHISAYHRALQNKTTKAEWFCTVEPTSAAKTNHLLLMADHFGPKLPGTERRKTAAAQAVEVCRRYSLTHLVFPLPTENAAKVAVDLFEGIFLGDFADLRYKSSPESKAPLRIEFTTTAEKLESVQAALKRHESILRGTQLARELVNAPNNALTPEAFCNVAFHLATSHPELNVAAHVGDMLELLGCNLIYAVGKGCETPPALLILRLPGTDATRRPLFLVGKGVCFDTGGYCIKDGNNMHKMNGDMGGAAAVLGAIIALTELRPAFPVVAVIPLAINAISGNAYMPGCIVASKGGKTVYVENTDAEGRLLLADALGMLPELGYQTGDTVVNLATLTGAAITALGERIGALFSNDAELSQTFQKAGEATGDNVWPLPLWPEYLPTIQHSLADLCNMSSHAPAGGAIHAANFLEQFLPEGARWVHLDMSRPARAAKGTRYYKEGATGFGVRLLVEALNP
jgi:leucyl aminopeptidase